MGLFGVGAMGEGGVLAKSWGQTGVEGVLHRGGKNGCRSREWRKSLLPSIFTGAELLNWELELERVPKTLQIQLHLESVHRGSRVQSVSEVTCAVVHAKLNLCKAVVNQSTEL